MDKIYKINYSWRPTYFQALQLTQVFFANPETPHLAAILCLLSRGNKLASSQRELRNWLYNYISPFAMNPVREEQNLEEKALAIATYFLLEENDQQDGLMLPDEQLINYLEYAEKQSWFDDPFLAFFCYQLKDRLTCCEKIDDYFQSKYELFLQKRHIPSISQSLIVLQNKVSTADLQRGYEAISSALKDADLPRKYLAWALWAYSERPNIHEQNILKVNLALEKEVVDILREIQWNSGLSSILAFAFMAKANSLPDTYLDKINQTFQEVINIYQDKNGYYLNIRPRKISEENNFTASDLGLILVALHKSNFDKITYVSGLQEEEIPVLEDSLDALKQGSIVLSSGEKLFVNFLVILFTFQIVLLILYLQAGLPSKITDIEFKVDYLATIIVWLDICIAQFRLALSGGNAIDSLKETIILRRLLSLVSKPKKKGISNGE